ncbi:daunorubicin resistance protein DrrA family ABC transporter ATP-binding protein [Actinomadura meridiana]|uniref:Daunorubicin resistance protein DrrA family ABC transporter ATP-binding protein n=1 Tax=Actinomadura meridiana TaxID=559626 RepID=A0ABP8CFG3_9ACTN
MSITAEPEILIERAPAVSALPTSTDEPPPALDVVDLVRDFTRRKSTPVRALDGMSLRVPRGEVHGLLGPNGAGKTTLVKILSTVLLPTGGHARIRGHDVVAEARAVRPLIGVVFGGDRGLYTRLTGRQNLEFWAAVQHVPSKTLRRRCAELLDRLGLSGTADRRVETYSRGMRQRLHLARGLVADAPVLFLDEPTMGMDPVAAREFQALIGELRGEGRTIVLATHNMAEAAELCDRVSFVRGGKVIDTRSPRALADLAAGAHGVEIDDDPDPVALAAVRALPGVTSVEPGAGSARIRVRGEEHLPDVLRTLADHRLTSVRTMRPTLEDVYLALIGDRGLEV